MEQRIQQDKYVRALEEHTRELRRARRPMGDLTFRGKVAGGSGAEGPGGHAAIDAKGNVTFEGELRGGDGGLGGPGGDASLTAGGGNTAPIPAPRPDLTLSDFIDQRTAEIGDDGDIDGHLAAIGSLFAGIRQEARLGHIRVWGRRDCPMGQTSVPLSPIEPTYWDDYHIDVVDFLCDPDRRFGRTEIARVARNEIAYTDIRLNKDEVLKIWPITNGPSS